MRSYAYYYSRILNPIDLLSTYVKLKTPIFRIYFFNFQEPFELKQPRKFSQAIILEEKKTWRARRTPRSTWGSAHPLSVAHKPNRVKEGFYPLNHLFDLILMYTPLSLPLNVYVSHGFCEFIRETMSL
jgi:hypothetical protein